MNDGNGGQSGHVRVYDWDGFIYLPRILMGRHQAIVSENQCLYHLTGSSWPLKLHQTMAILMYVPILWLVLQHQLQLHSVEWECRY